MTAEVTRRSRQRESPLPISFVQPRERLIDVDLHDDRRLRRDVADLLCEEVRPILLEERSRASLDERALIVLARLRSGLHLSSHDLFADMEGEESLDPATLGMCQSVQEVRVGDGEMLHFDGCAGAGASTVILRGANEYMLDEMERALHDAFCVVKRLLESNTIVPGGGAVETALSVYLENYANHQMDTREQLAVQEFAEALLVIPKQLAINAAQDSSELVAKLRAVHAASQQSDSKDSKKNDNLKNYGLNLLEGTVQDNLAAGITEPAMSKVKSLRFATEAAITILRIDDRITVTQQQ